MQVTDIPELEGATPVTGHQHLMDGDRVELMRMLADMQRDLVRMRFWAQTVLVANGPEVVYDVLVGKARDFEKSPVLRSGLYPLAGDGLFTSEGELWKRQRKLMAPIFRMRELRRYADCMADCAEHAADFWAEGEVIDVPRETTRIAMSVAGKTLFDADTFSEADELGEALTVALDWVNEQVSSPLLIAQTQVKTALMLASHRLPQPLADWAQRGTEALHPPIVLPGARKARLRRALDVLERRVERMIAERRSDEAPPADLLTALLHARDEDDGSTMSDRQVRDEVLTLFIAGHETTAAGLAWSLHLLNEHPEAYERAEAEADALDGDAVRAHPDGHARGRLTFEALERLPFCLQVFKEALRMYPPIYMFGRQAMNPMTLRTAEGEYDIPRGTVVLLCPYSMHYREDVWPEPDRFDPSRFAPEAEQARPREAYLPFSGGPRTCIGNHFALMEGPLVLATLLRRAHFERARGGTVTLEPGATLRPADLPMHVRFRV